MKPTIGSLVLYKLAAYDAEQINARRSDAGAFTRTLAHPIAQGDRGRTGHVLHNGNQASEGQVFPAFIVATFGNGTTSNLHVLLDGSDTYWATSRQQGDDPCQWQWPARPEREPGDRPATY
jgi:hypothetical protein